jgi:XTP/dITP diphosphohydrolase
MTELYFATSNANKFDEVRKILSNCGVRVAMMKLELTEVQSDDLARIASEKAKNAYTSLHENVIVEDDGLFIDSLKKFPGPYSAFVYKTIGNEGILKLLEGITDRMATFKSIIAYCDSDVVPVMFVGEVRGAISEISKGRSWGYDPIFVPNDSGGLTYAELASRKNELSHRKLALEQFAKWYTEK